MGLREQARGKVSIATFRGIYSTEDWAEFKKIEETTGEIVWTNRIARFSARCIFFHPRIHKGEDVENGEKFIRDDLYRCVSAKCIFFHKFSPRGFNLKQVESFL